MIFSNCLMRTSKSLSEQLKKIESMKPIRKKTSENTSLRIITIFLLLMIAFGVGYSVNPSAYKARNPAIVSNVAEKVLPSIVSITDDNSSGSGIIISKDGYIITNYHVVDQLSENSRVLTQEKEIFPVKLVGYDGPSDLAILKIDADNLSPARFGNSDSVHVGEEVIAI